MPVCLGRGATGAVGNGAITLALVGAALKNSYFPASDCHRLMFPSETVFPAPAAVLDMEQVLSAAAYGLAGAGRQRLLIGIEGPMSGPQKDTGRDLWRASRLAAREINQDGGILGLKVKLIKVDDRADPERALQVAERLRRRGAIAVIGPYNSGVGLVNLPYYTTNGIIPLHLTSSDLTEGFGLTLQQKNSQIAPAEVAYMLAQGVKKVSILVDPSAFSIGMADRVQTSLEASGVAVQRFTIDPDAADYAAVIAAAVDGDPDLVYVST